MIRDLYDNSIVAYKTGTQQTVNLVSVVSECDGNLIVNIKESRIALSKLLASKIFVS